ncbi:MAG: proline--tRNA ligase [Sedimentisphaerales bacterium]|nr:proline--tRNA ligase [Sedimentisphaerales bacterium]
MRFSQLFAPTVKEVPADAEVISHILMVRAGIFRKVSSGTYTYLPLGQRSLLKIIGIIRQEMDRAGAQEILMPSLQPKELWDQTGRSRDYGPTMFTLQDRHGRMNVLGPTAEEVATFLAASEINSYKQLPINLYQISPKFRDEFRPRFGAIRSREFIMKDAYSFHASAECLDKTYQAMYQAYCRIFTSCGLPYIVVEAETGEMGGSGSHQFTVPCESGEDTIVMTEDGSYAANLERAPADPLPRSEPADVSAPSLVHTPDIGSIEAVCRFLGTTAQQMIKTLIYTVEGQPVAVLIRGDHEVNSEKLRRIFSGSHLELADPRTIELCTGAKVGFAGPIGLVEQVSCMVIDHAVVGMPVAVTGANKTDYHMQNVVPGRDFPLAGDKVIVADVRNACPGDSYMGKRLIFRKGIEVGQVFKLGTKYSSMLGANLRDAAGQIRPCLMGCYGIGVNRIMASAIEVSHDDRGIIWPISIAPFEVIVTCVNQDEPQIASAAEQIYHQLQQAGADVLLDDRHVRGGVKFNDADLIGIPIRVTIGSRSIATGQVEIKRRDQDQVHKIDMGSVVEAVMSIIRSMKAQLEPAAR